LRIVGERAAATGDDEGWSIEDNGKFRWGLREGIAPEVRAFWKRMRGGKGNLSVFACVSTACKDVGSVVPIRGPLYRTIVERSGPSNRIGSNRFPGGPD
jgi:hypothetical protein